MQDPPLAPEGPQPGGRPRWLRLSLLVLLTAGLLGLSKVTGLGAHLRPEEIHARMAAAGWWGPLLYIVAFAVGELVHVPGWVFVAAAVVAYGRATGAALALAGALVSISVTFAVVRGVGGKPLGAIRWRWVARMLAHLDEHPVRTIILLRLVLWLTPQLNYVLALSHVRYRSYLVGSAVGLVAPVIILSLLVDHFLR